MQWREDEGFGPMVLLRKKGILQEFAAQFLREKSWGMRAHKAPKFLKSSHQNH